MRTAPSLDCFGTVFLLLRTAYDTVVYGQIREERWGGIFLSLVSVLLLGLLQGLTEFLPVSSSGHLVLAQSFLSGFSQPGALLDVALHLGTLGAVCVYFRRDIFLLATACFSADHPEAATSRRFLWLLVLGSVPTMLIGLTFREQFESLFTNPQGAGLALLVTGTLLFVTDCIRGQGRLLSEMRVRDAVLIGIAQGCAIIPGLSRSGTTIAAGVLLGLERDLLVRYSFLLSVPMIGGAFLLQLMLHWEEVVSEIDVFAYTLGTLVAAGVGYASIPLLIRMTRSQRLSPFAYYCWAIGGLAVLCTTSF